MSQQPNDAKPVLGKKRPASGSAPGGDGLFAKKKKKKVNEGPGYEVVRSDGTVKGKPQGGVKGQKKAFEKV